MTGKEQKGTADVIYLGRKGRASNLRQGGESDNGADSTLLREIPASIQKEEKVVSRGG